MSAGVEIRDLKKEFGVLRWQGWRRSLSQVRAVDGVTLDVPEGQSVAFIGPNGAGKSTTIKILTGILQPTSGHATVLGYTPWIERRKLVQHIGAVFGQRSQLWYHLPPSDTFELIARIYGLDRREFAKTRDALIDRFAMGSFMNIPVRKLSLGQRMRAEVAASLLHRPRIIFLDEPTIGLDAVARQELRDLIREWNAREGATILLTSHDAGDIEHVADRVIVINHGRVVVDGPVAEVRRRYVNTRILRAQFQELPKDIDIPGSVFRNRSAYEWTLEIDVTVTPVQRAIAQVLEAAPIADIAVEDPPLEHVITRIYKEVAT
jgi:ABC-2 type transport system ATP-binding protein